VVLLILEFIGTQELFLIMVVALVVFGPRKLPEIGRSLGKTLNEFRRASEDFKRTWQMEADLEKAEKQAIVERQASQIEGNTNTLLPLPEVRDSDFDGTIQPSQATTRDDARDTIDNLTPNSDTSNATHNETSDAAPSITPDATPNVAETVPRESKPYAAPAPMKTSDTAARS